MSQGDNSPLVMSEDIEVDDIAILPIGTEINGTQPSAPKRKQIRTTNYSQEEDLQLCKSWENVSLHPVTGTEQLGKAYWKRIHDNFHANKTFASNRNENSLEHRWGVIHKECQKFQGLFEEVERRHPSGVPYEEHLLEAQNAYANNDPKKKGFSFLHCWLKIRHSQKFMPPTTNKRPRRSNSPPTTDVFDLEDDESIKSQTPDSSMPNGRRRMERKQAKEKMKKGGKQTNPAELLEKWLTEKEKIRDDRWQENKMMEERKLSLEERKLSLEERKVANEEKKMLWEKEQKIMFCDLDMLEPSQKTYVIAMRAQIAAEKKAAFNNAFVGSSGGHEASGGHSGGG
ncbi:hypothetical protein BDA96_04G062100 [Sorghum bicolor]|uniref:No apical meristem-associated C-terminal domain-containing protein n=2 Tax=Sorghum bicolor TaxID=4558 RepID=C5XW46_SORBI|nr:uncharacterized protein LOC8077178 isoform X2 [Sorghum bicolor]EES04596.1 hypothetical protein SORBI_3004G056600 [Sorghum bicolor]KAG0531904.1 hypothetical protein BDA96_04G062100 [Sorghum bicolor]OQU84449.1 hypothetical protein SORBI_3004G056600 [Sorghum bicolor]|eukprot:XP_002451620.1 uncharacterized protein LOC8077178 isoform X2 [Sorghum bicolor]